MNKKYIIIVVLIVFSASFNKMYAQEQLGVRGLAKKYYNQYQYFQAVPFYQKLVDTKKPFLEDMEQLADCYFKLKDYEAAENWYSRIIKHPKSKPENLLRYGEVLKSNLKYNEAKKFLQEYGLKSGDQSSVASVILGCDSALSWLANPSLYQLKNEMGINTKLSEFSLFSYQQKFFFTGEPDTVLFKSIYGRTGHSYLRIFTADKTNNLLSNPLIDQSIYNNGQYHIGPLASNKSGSILYVTRTTSGKKLERNEIDKIKYLTNNLELYIYKNTNGTWEEKPFIFNDVEKYSVGHATLSADEKVLYFVSNMPGGLGGTDIWFCELQPDGNWGKPQNAGKNINTINDEMFPFINGDGTLYFSSNGLPGMGGLDIFTANGNKENWSKAINLRYPLNSSADDFGYFSNGSSTQDTFSGYINSNRKGGKGGDDIYSFTYQKPKINLAVSGIITNKKTGEIIPAASVTLFSAGRVIVARQSSNNNGKFFLELDKDKDYTIVAEKPKFKSDSIALSTKGLTKSDTIAVALNMESLFEVGKVFKLNDINYDFNKDNIRLDAAKILDDLVVIMRDNATLEIELGSHTDSRGADIYNLNLSQRRAQSVVNYLVAKGISRERMIAKGYGEMQLLNNCANGIICTDAQHQENRRTEFKVLKY
jgi:outer membrane protein OmpA-like peptidoglycan-associated protein/tetratricopeptide (TPR) repeat protein